MGKERSKISSKRHSSAASIKAFNRRLGRRRSPTMAPRPPRRRWHAAQEEPALVSAYTRGRPKFSSGGGKSRVGGCCLSVLKERSSKKNFLNRKVILPMQHLQMLGRNEAADTEQTKEACYRGVLGTVVGAEAAEH